MRRSRKRLVSLLAAVPVLVVVLALLYQLGMAGLEGRGRGFWDSVEWAASTLTTTGYGADHHWRHPAMVVYVTIVQFLGLFMVYLIFPIYLIPFLEERFEVRLPQESPGDMAGHAVIYRYGPAVETLLQELAAARVPTLVLEADEAVARRLHEGGQRIVHRGQADGALGSARLGQARALIANGSDDENAAVILSARQLGFGGPILALVEDPFHRQPMMLAGASAVFTPRHILGAALAARASARINPRLAGVQQLSRNLEVAEVRVAAHSPLAGKSLAETAIGTRTGAKVIGQWLGGELALPGAGGELALPGAGDDWRIQAGGILVAVGAHDSIARLTDLAGSGGTLRPREGHFVVGGYGEVGRKVVELLRAVGEEVRVIDRRPATGATAGAGAGATERAGSAGGTDGTDDGVDVAGNVLELPVLEAAGVRDAQAVVLALDTDSATLFATVILKDLAPDVPVIARVNQAENVDRIHRAGAYFALSISQISGQMLAKKLLGQEAVAVDPQLKVLKLDAGPLTGRHPAELHARARNRCTVAAVERGDEVLVEFGSDFRLQPQDTIYLCGSGDAVRRFGELYRLPAA